MTFDLKLTPARKVAALKIHFVIIGGGIGGLGAAVALRRVGHQVTVIERDSDVYQAVGGCRMPPNLSKILFHWGLEKDVYKIGLKVNGLDMKLFETGELLGRHTWDVEMLKETRGEFIFTAHADLRKLLYDAAISLGATVRMGVEAVGVEPDTRSVKLSTGEILTGDVIIGADGVKGICRQLVASQQEVQEPVHRFNAYATVLPKSFFEQDPELAPLYASEYSTHTCWFGNMRAIVAYPMGNEDPQWGMYTYGPKDGHEGGWQDPAPVSGLQAICATGEPVIQKLAKLSPKPPACLPVLEFEALEDWIYDDSTLCLLGDAAHPFPAGGIHEAAMALEDGAVLAKLFSHIRTYDQIVSLLFAFQDLRQPHVQRVYRKEVEQDIGFMTLPPGEEAEGRNDWMRSRRDAGLDVLASDGDSEELSEWSESKEVFGYDAEDDADNWWMEWGLLRERARGTDISKGFVEPIAIKTGRMSVSEPVEDSCR